MKTSLFWSFVSEFDVKVRKTLIILKNIYSFWKCKSCASLRLTSTIQHKYLFLKFLISWILCAPILCLNGKNVDYFENYWAFWKQECARSAYIIQHKFAFSDFFFKLSKISPKIRFQYCQSNYYCLTNVFIVQGNTNW